MLFKILRIKKKVFGKGRVGELNQSRETQSCTLQLKQKKTKLIRIWTRKILGCSEYTVWLSGSAETIFTYPTDRTEIGQPKSSDPLCKS